MANRLTGWIIHHDEKNVIPGATGIELEESTALFSLSSDGGGGEGRGEEPRFYWISPLPNPLPARSSQGEGDRRPAFRCLLQWHRTPALPQERENRNATPGYCAGSWVVIGGIEIHRQL